MVTILLMSAKLATLIHLKTDVIASTTSYRRSYRRKTGRRTFLLTSPY